MARTRDCGDALVAQLQTARDVHREAVIAGPQATVVVAAAVAEAAESERESAGQRAVEEAGRAPQAHCRVVAGVVQQGRVERGRVHLRAERAGIDKGAQVRPIRRKLGNAKT